MNMQRKSQSKFKFDGTVETLTISLPLLIFITYTASAALCHPSTKADVANLKFTLGVSGTNNNNDNAESLPPAVLAPDWTLLETIAGKANNNYFEIKSHVKRI